MSNTNKKKAAEIIGKLTKIVLIVFAVILGKKRFGGGNNSGQQNA